MSRNPHHGRKREEELLRVAEQAAEWLVTLESDPAAGREDLARWLLESPLHVEMFLRAAAIDRKASSLHPAVTERLLERLETESVDNVVTMQSHARPAAPARVRRHFLPKGLPVAAAASLFLAAAIWFFAPGAMGWARYVTDIGEQRSITLQDGSLIHINTHSRVDVRYTDSGRDVRLMRGEALFTVHEDRLRPFRVHVDDTVVRAIGTQFNVYRRAGATTVAVIEGVVQISKERAEASALQDSGTEVSREPTSRRAPKRLAAGEAATVEPDGGVKTVAVDPAQVTAWRQGELVFERASLQEIVREFNRYNRKPRLRVDGRIGTDNRYTAMFNTNEPATLLRFLEKDPHLELILKGDELVVEPRAPR